jgi:hypothetical protein
MRYRWLDRVCILESRRTEPPCQQQDQTLGDHRRAFAFLSLHRSHLQRFPKVSKVLPPKSSLRGQMANADSEQAGDLRTV